MASSPSFRGIIGKGLLFGGLAGAVWVANRRYHGVPPPLIDWRRVRDSAVALADRDASGEAAARPSTADLTSRYQAMVGQSDELIGSYIGSRLPARQNTVHVFDRREWIEANVAGFQSLFEPLERINREAFADGTVGTFLLGNLNQLFLSGQMGMLVGVLSRRVLGQYDLALFGREPITGGRLYFVEPNIARLQARLDLDPRELRLWIALHETTHAYEFEGHPWLRDHLNGLLGSYFASLSRDLLALRRRSSGALDLASRVGSNLLRSSHALELVMSDEQRQAFRRLQGLMCLLEGYSNHVMDRIGGTLLATYPVLKSRFEDRLQHRSLGEQILARMTGLDVKLEQYVLGERFVGEVVRQRDISYVNRAWASPWHLPTLDEIRKPARWIDRVAGEPRV